MPSKLFCRRQVFFLAFLAKFTNDEICFFLALLAKVINGENFRHSGHGCFCWPLRPWGAGLDIDGLGFRLRV